MKRTVSSALVLMLGLLMSHTQVSGQTPVGTAFTYQGRLEQNGSPVNESCDFQFELWDAASGGSQVGSTITTNGVTVTDGLFTVTVDFGENTFVGEARWLDIAVCCPSGDCTSTPLPPRQRITPAPNALYATNTSNLQLPFSGSVSTTYGGAALSITNTRTEGPALGGYFQSDGTGSAIALKGVANGSDGFNYGGQFQAIVSSAGTGIRAEGNACGVMGTSKLASGYGGYFATSATEASCGVYARGGEYGVYAESEHLTSPDYGVRAVGGLYGVFGTCNFSGGAGVFGEDGVPGSYAGYFAGDVHVTGTLTGGKGGLKIDHPLDPENKYLYHSFVESPDMKNVYDGNVITDANGHAEVVLPEWFEVLNKDFRYQLTVIGQFAQAIVASKIKDNRFTIKTDKPHVEVSWQVTGIRKDPCAERYRIPVEEEKPEKHRGKYLHPELYGQPKESAVHYVPPREEPVARRSATLKP